MADYIFTVASNEFKTKNNEEVSQVFQDLGFEESYVTSGGYVFVGSYGEGSLNDDMIVVKEKATGKVIGAYDTYNGMFSSLQEFLDNLPTIEDEDFDEMSVEDWEKNRLKEEDYSEIPLVDYLQDMLEDKEVFVLKEVGNEKLRYVGGCATIIGKNFTEFVNLDYEIEKIVEAKGLEV